MFLNLGCGSDTRGEVRIDKNPYSFGVNLIGDAHHLPMREDIVDDVFNRSNLEHLISPFLALKEMTRVSRNRVRVIVPNLHEWRRIMRALIFPDHEVPLNTLHFQGWDSRLFKLLVNQIEGLEIEKIGYGYFRKRMKWPSMLCGSKMIVKMRVNKCISVDAKIDTSVHPGSRILLGSRSANRGKSKQGKN